MIEIARNSDGRLIIANNRPFHSTIQRVEYYRDLRLLMLSYEGQEENSELMPCEINEEVAQIMKRSPDIIILELKQGAPKQTGYIAPLVQIGL